MGNCCTNHFQVNDEDIPVTNVVPSGSNGLHHSDGSNVVSNGPNGSDGSNGLDGSNGPDGSNGLHHSHGPNGSDGSNGSDKPDGSNESARLIPRYFDWHNQDEAIFWPIEQQTGDFCWLHVVVDTLEELYAITHNRQRIKLSKQEIVDKVFGYSKPKYNSRTNTYSVPMEDVYNWIIDNGLSLEQDYGSGKYEATLQVPKDRIPGCPIFNLSGVGRIFSSDEDRILKELDNSPGAAVLIMDSDQMDSLITSQDTNAVYSIATDARKHRLHGVVLSGYDDTGSRNAYWVRDPLKSRAPNKGHYRVTRASGVQAGERDPIVYVLFPYGVSLSESSTSNTL